MKDLLYMIKSIVKASVNLNKTISMCSMNVSLELETTVKVKQQNIDRLVAYSIRTVERSGESFH